MSQYLNLAKQKRSQGDNIDFQLSFHDFICECYVKLKPCSYGVRIQKKLSEDLGLKVNPASLNIGDVVINSKNGELKVSYLGKNNCYSLTHLRMWQKFGYYLFCLIDCDNDFTPEFYLIDKYVMNKMKMTPMNGTKDSNSDNSNIELRASVKKNGEYHSLLKKENKLCGNSLTDLISYIKN